VYRIGYRHSSAQLPPPSLPARAPTRHLAVSPLSPLSYRDVEELLAERGLDISYETVRRWVLKFGPAINLGDVIVEDGDIFGDGVNVAARLEALEFHVTNTSYRRFFERDLGWILRRLPLIARAGFPVRCSTPGEQTTEGAPSRRIAAPDLSRRPGSELGRRQRSWRGCNREPVASHRLTPLWHKQS
jgi:hypothetical protein